ncbi:energy transducer TonB [Prevotella sp. 10(H)]|uniref:energy transducer TonB n=1 Tax=Prevotella sp. 10(H) TaxID=1158294 RepID=UPI0004A6CE02|nr:energy transducer TonB [Prevotella sp. 10(H)]
MKKIFVLLFLLVSIVSYSQDKDRVDSDIFIDFDTIPQFPGGEEKMYEFIKKNLIYPISALDAKVEGRVTTRFVVRATGDITDVQVLRGIHPDCDSLAVEIIRSMPKWIPGKKSGFSIDTKFTLPIIFRLPDDGIADGEQIRFTAEYMPSFPGGTDEMFKFIKENLRWPDGDACFQGRVTVRFVVNKKGKIVRPEVVRSVTPKADKEALRVVGIMPDWIPGMHNGEAVNVYYTIPIVFR